MILKNGGNNFMDHKFNEHIWSAPIQQAPEETDRKTLELNWKAEL